MRYTPKPCDRRAHTIMWLMIAAGALCFMLSSVFAGSRAVLQLGATVLIGGGIYVGVRYIMTEFTYEIVPRDTALPQGEAAPAFAGNTADLPASMLDLVVRKQNSRRGAVTDACMNLGELRYFAPLPREGGREREPYKLFPDLRVFAYTVSVAPQAQYIAVFVDSAGNAIGLVLEPDEAFAAVLSRAVRANGEENA